MRHRWQETGLYINQQQFPIRVTLPDNTLHTILQKLLRLIDRDNDGNAGHAATLLSDVVSQRYCTPFPRRGQPGFSLPGLLSAFKNRSFSLTRTGRLRPFLPPACDGVRKTLVIS